MTARRPIVLVPPAGCDAAAPPPTDVPPAPDQPPKSKDQELLDALERMTRPPRGAKIPPPVAAETLPYGADFQQLAPAHVDTYAEVRRTIAQERAKEVLERERARIRMKALLAEPDCSAKAPADKGCAPKMKRTAFKRNRVLAALADLYPDGWDTVPPAEATDRLNDHLKPKKRISQSTVKRAINAAKAEVK